MPSNAEELLGFRPLLPTWITELDLYWVMLLGAVIAPDQPLEGQRAQLLHLDYTLWPINTHPKGDYPRPVLALDEATTPLGLLPLEGLRLTEQQPITVGGVPGTIASFAFPGTPPADIAAIEVFWRQENVALRLVAVEDVPAYGPFGVRYHVPLANGPGFMDELWSRTPLGRTLIPGGSEHELEWVMLGMGSSVKPIPGC